MKILCIASMIGAFLIGCGLEGGALSVFQASVMLVPTGTLMACTFMHTDWYDA